MNSFGSKVKYFFGLENEDELDYDNEGVLEVSEPASRPLAEERAPVARDYPKSHRDREIAQAQPRPVTSRLVICKYTPLDHRETTSMIDDVRLGRPVIINFQETEDFVAAKIINICEGAAYALDADIMKIASDIYIVVPEGVDLKSHVPASPQEEEDLEDELDIR